MTYTYQCVNLKHAYNVQTVNRSMFEPEVAPKCAICEQEMHRVYDAAPTHFAGGGWGKQAR
jgi:predicted nucleic acid-binding Zn ribbon protein